MSDDTEAKVTVTLSAKLALEGDIFDSLTRELAGETIVYMMKSMVLQGTSPVRGHGKFEPYSQSYIDQMQGRVKFRTINGRRVAFHDYDKDGVFNPSFEKDPQFASKTPRPVNLCLSNSMLEALGWRETNDPGVLEIGFFKGTDRDQEIAGYHQEGTDTMPRRPVLPDEGRGEEMAVSIQQAIKQIYRDRVNAIIEESNNS